MTGLVVTVCLSLYVSSDPHPLHPSRMLLTTAALLLINIKTGLSVFISLAVSHPACARHAVTQTLHYNGV